MSERYAVMGNPIAHSRSPFIHARFAAQTGEPVVYEAILVEPGAFDAAVAGFRGEGGAGLNVTVPFKVDAFELATERSARAERAGAVNTLRLDPDGLYGDNTDGVGLVTDLTRNHGVALEGSQILMLGAGGAARGVLGPLLDAAPARVVICNRTHHRAVALAERFADQGAVSAMAMADLAADRFDIVVNATAAGLSGGVPDVPGSVFGERSFAYDMMYGPSGTSFLEWSREHGASQAVDGLGMLVEQAAESFALWRGVRPATIPVIEAVRAALQT